MSCNPHPGGVIVTSLLHHVIAVIDFSVCRFKDRLKGAFCGSASEDTPSEHELTFEARLSIPAWTWAHLQETQDVPDIYTSGSSRWCWKTWLSHCAGVSVRRTRERRYGNGGLAWVIPRHSFALSSFTGDDNCSRWIVIILGSSVFRSTYKHTCDCWANR